MDDLMFDELLNSVREADKIIHGKVQASRVFEFDEIQITEIREGLGLSQSEFALLIGVSKRTLENWEQGRRHPTGPAKALLKIVQKNPKVALEALHS